jgi:hypothetical protein
MCYSLVRNCIYRCDIQANQAADGVISSFDVLADLLESIEQFVDRFAIYTQIAPTPALDKVVVKWLVELISTLALVTKKLTRRRLREPTFSLLRYYLTQCDTVKRVFNFFAVKDIKDAQERLNKRMREESQYVNALTLGRVGGVEKMLTEGEQTHTGL